MPNCRAGNSEGSRNNGESVAPFAKLLSFGSLVMLQSIRGRGSIIRIFILLCSAVCTSACISAGAPPAFYTFSGTDRSAARGALIRYEYLPDSPAGGRAYRILYFSSDNAGRLIPVSGMVVVPSNPAPAHSRPVVAWSHPTTGVQPQCAPSLSPLRFVMIAGLSDMLKRGYVVTASDYPGLGSGTVHPFLDGSSEGRAVLDSVRAAAALPNTSASKNFALWGHSQGGQAALFAANMVASYAPELRIAGVAAAAPATDLAALLRDDVGSAVGNKLTAFTLWSWARVYGASYKSVVQSPAMPAINTIAHNCWDSLLEGRSDRNAAEVLAKGYFKVPDITKVEPWRSLVALNTPGTLPPKIPVFLSQGDADTTVRPTITYGYAAELCRRGSRVRLDVLPNVTHSLAAIKSASSAMNWIGDRFDGVLAPTDCERIKSLK